MESPRNVRYESQNYYDRYANVLDSRLEDIRHMMELSATS